MLVLVVATVALLTVSTLFSLLLGRFIAHGDQPDPQGES